VLLKSNPYQSLFPTITHFLPKAAKTKTKKHNPAESGNPAKISAEAGTEFWYSSSYMLL